jgi:hypothetical protein
MNKTEIYTWRVAPDLKSALEEAARAEHTSVSRLLDRIASGWLGEARSRGDQDAAQRRLQAAAAACIGTIRGGDPRRAEEATARVRARLKERHASARAG